jgi:predicted negative regulator of RcsB-dependent stress response
MKDRVTFLVITSKTGAQRRFSLRKNVIYCIIIIAGFLLGSGIIGAWKYRENASLQKKNMLLEAEKGQLEAVARAVKDIKNEEKGIRKLLGLENGEADEGKNLEY